MEFEFSVELGPDDPTLAVPWRSPDGTIAYVDLRSSPEAIDSLSEVRAFPELADFLRAFNRHPYATAKCDAWFDTLMDVNDEPYAASLKCASYVDIFFPEAPLAPFAEIESHARAFVRQVRNCQIDEARAELCLRRAYFASGEGFYWTLYLTGYGSTQEEARAAWAAALKLMV